MYFLSSWTIDKTSTKAKGDVGHLVRLPGCKKGHRKFTLCFWLLQIPKKFLPGCDSCFQTYLMQEIQKYDLNWNSTSPFWATSYVALPIQPFGQHFCGQCCSALKNGSLDFNLSHTFRFLASSRFENNCHILVRIFLVFALIKNSGWVVKTSPETNQFFILKILKASGFFSFRLGFSVLFDLLN